MDGGFTPGMTDIAVVGAGLSGLFCARYLHDKGYRVVVVEKSKGLGGRVATRRLGNTCVDHGLPYLPVQGPLTEHLVHMLGDRIVLHPWGDRLYQWDGTAAIPSCPTMPIYVAEAGMTSIIKSLATGLTIHRAQRVQQLNLTADRWSLTLDAVGDEVIPPITVPLIVLAIPAPQAVPLVAPLVQHGFPEAVLHQLQAVEFEPRISAIATFSRQAGEALQQQPWGGLQILNHEMLSWVVVDASKRKSEAVLPAVIHSNATFAAQWLDATDLQPAGEQLLHALYQLLPWLDQPLSLQVHRWRYALPVRSLSVPFLQVKTPLPLLFCGDWCGAGNSEAAMATGFSTARHIEQHWSQNSN